MVSLKLGRGEGRAGQEEQPCRLTGGPGDEGPGQLEDGLGQLGDGQGHLDEGLGHLEGDSGHLEIGIAYLEGIGKGPYEGKLGHLEEGGQSHLKGNTNEEQNHLDSGLEEDGEGIDCGRRKSDQGVAAQLDSGQVGAPHLRDLSEENIGNHLVKLRLDNCADEIVALEEREPRIEDLGNIPWLSTEKPCNNKATIEHFHENGLSEVRDNQELGRVNKVIGQDDESWPELIGEHLV